MKLLPLIEGMSLDTIKKLRKYFVGKVISLYSGEHLIKINQIIYLPEPDSVIIRFVTVQKPTNIDLIYNFSTTGIEQVMRKYFNIDTPFIVWYCENEIGKIELPK